MGSEFEFRWEEEFLFHHIVQTGSGAHPAFYPRSIGALSPGVKRPGREADHTPPFSAKVKKTWVNTSTPHMPSWRSA
jgi:hypothetical protein